MTERAQQLYELSFPPVETGEDGKEIKHFKPWDELGLGTVKLWEQWAARTDVEHDDVELPPTELASVNQAQAVMMVCFRAGIDCVIALDPQLVGEDWGGPPPHLVTDSKMGEMIIQLHAKYHHHMEAEFLKPGFYFTVSYDRQYRVMIPWDAIKRVMVYPQVNTDDVA